MGEEAGLTKRYDQDVRPNDPMYLMRGTSAPDPYKNDPAFDFVGEKELKYKYAGEEHPVKIRYSVTKPEPRLAGRRHPGSSA